MHCERARNMGGVFVVDVDSAFRILVMDAA